ncbi:hypothetical protein FM996_02130 [Methylosinus sporium]|uniref:Uncharacterized protein n=1 Tax=Methylosinus sporium TaxID=428 RepID=A0A549T6V6_METSR|nr:hypothetical protein [Methylosinus sporium]TRL37580.1 hypothetical protein FM996_02130 [Methylosinus sporium]
MHFFKVHMRTLAYVCVTAIMAIDSLIEITLRIQIPESFEFWLHHLKTFLESMHAAEETLKLWEMFAVWIKIVAIPIF